MNISTYKENAKLIRDTNIYKVYDLTTLKNLNLSLTELNSEKSTGGHSHDDADEIYIFINGEGFIQIGETVEKCVAGDVFIIPRSKYHKVINTSNCLLQFWSIFEKYETRK